MSAHTDDLRAMLATAVGADEPVTAAAIRRLLAAREEKDAAERSSGRLPVLLDGCDCGGPDQCDPANLDCWTTCRLAVRRDHEASVLGASSLAELGLTQSGDDLVEHVPDPNPPARD